MQRLAARAQRGWNEAQQVRWPAHCMHAPYAWLHNEQLSWNRPCSSNTLQPQQGKKYYYAHVVPVQIFNRAHACNLIVLLIFRYIQAQESKAKSRHGTGQYDSM